jgi:Hemolysin coregulated protein Hcp (TssD)
MASFNAKLVVGGFEYNVLSCEYSLHQPTDSRGKTLASVKSGLIRLTLASESRNKHKALSDWAIAVKKSLDGIIVFDKIDGLGQSFKTVSFFNGHCVSYREIFTPYGGVASALTVNIGITAEKMKIGNVNHDNLWVEKANK